MGTRKRPLLGLARLLYGCFFLLPMNIYKGESLLVTVTDAIRSYYPLVRHKLAEARTALCMFSNGQWGDERLSEENQKALSSAGAVQEIFGFYLGLGIVIVGQISPTGSASDVPAVINPRVMTIEEAKQDPRYRNRLPESTPVPV